MRTKLRPIEVLLVEDHPGDARLTQEAFRNCARPIQLHHAWNGDQAWAFLQRRDGYARAPRPSLILLDLNMNGMSGLETLALIKADPSLREIPVIVLTTSDNEADVLACYKLGANCYLRKPAQWDAFESLMGMIDAFWFARTKLPRMTALA
jgi:two-component system, chemotaxis family, response regulator Rcp1